jgi:tetratricopeptide (TPR) repeat protein
LAPRSTSNGRARRLVWAAALLCLAYSEAALATDDPNARVLRLERWLKAALRHEPGTQDDSSREVAAWSYADLRVLRADEVVMAKLLHKPHGPISAVTTRDIPAYTAWQVGRLRDLAEAYSTDNDHNRLLVRGALLHGDVAMSSPATGAPESGNEGIRIQSVDGEAVGFGASPIHWQMAWLLFDAARPDGDAIARRWYIATAAWMQSREQHDATHLRRAREMFPDDAALQFLSGCQQETFAGPEVQATVKTAVLPAGYHMDIESESAALRDAETFLRRALMLDPGMTEARIRLGHVLLARGRPQEAADALRAADTANEPTELQYFHAMFLGQAEESLGRVEQARESYTRASTLFPRAQSPYLALGALATRRGDRATALKETQRLFELPAAAVEVDEPWWSYRVIQARNADALLEALFRAPIR